MYFDYEEFFNFGTMSQEGERFRDFLFSTGLADSLEIQDIDLKKWFEVLKNTPYAFQIKKLTGFRGKAYVQGCFFYIFSFEDSKIIKKIRIKD